MTSLVYIMAVPVIGAKPLFGAMLIYYWLNLYEYISLKFESKWMFIPDNAFETLVCKIATILSGRKCLNKEWQDPMTFSIVISSS